MPEHRLAVVLPALDEEAAIGAVVAGFQAAGACCVFVVDGGSADATRERAAAAGASIVREPGRGYGRACLAGAAAAAGHTLVAFADADGSCDPADLPVLAAAAASADVVLGRRDAPEPGSLPAHAGWGNRVVAAYLALRSDRRVGDLPPFKLLRGSALTSLGLDETGYGWTVQLVARALSRPDLRVVERPVRFRARAGGESKVSGRLGPSLRAAAAMLGQAHRSSRPRGLVLLMAKAPRPGHSKTRLAAGLGEAGAVGFWRACLRDTAAAIERQAADAGMGILAVVPAELDAVAVTAITGLPCLVQRGPGLGAALAEGFAAAAARGAPYAMAVSADHPTLPADRVQRAAAALRRGSSAIGPTTDGGYYLLGLPLPAGLRRLPALFADIAMGGPGVLEQTLRALPGAVRLAAWSDVDTADELEQLAGQLRGNPGAAPATAAWLSGREAEPEAGDA